MRLQETPDEIPKGETPHSTTLFAFDDVVDAVRPGDRVEVTGIFRAVPRRPNPKMRSVRTVYKTHLDVVHFRLLALDEHATARADLRGSVNDGSNVDDAAEALGLDNDARRAAQRMFSRARVEEIEALGRAGDVYEQLVAALAPSIWQLDDVKKGVLCQLFGGTNRAGHVARGGGGAGGGDSHGGGERLRGEINVLLCGDPGTSKSQLLGYVHKIAPRGIYTSGKGSSAVGLTASVARDPETREPVLESGALVLSDLGVCCIDEFDKMTDATRAVLHEVMEQQTISLAKAGIICTLNARTSILASANPAESRYNPRLSVVENIQLPPTLLSRFDLIYLVLDRPDAESDRRLARHLVSLYYQESERPKSQSKVDTRLLRDYVAYAREAIHPELSDEAANELVESYLRMRQLGGAGGAGAKTITATPRQLEGLVRLAEALARMRLCDTVTRADVAEAVRLMKVATQSAATNPRTGQIDMDLITTGRTALDREQLGALASELREVLEGMRGQRVALHALRARMMEQNQVDIAAPEIRQAVELLADDDNAVAFNEKNGTVMLR